MIALNILFLFVKIFFGLCRCCICLFQTNTLKINNFQKTQFQTASSIIDLLKNYNQTDTQLKTQNIFSLAPTSPAQINNMREKYLTLDIDPVVSVLQILGYK